MTPPLRRSYSREEAVDFPFSVVCDRRTIGRGRTIQDAADNALRNIGAKVVQSDPLTPVDWKPYHDGEDLNFSFSHYTLGNPFTGSIASGWCLYAMHGSCWNQRTKAAFPPRPGMAPERIDGRWVWVETEARRVAGENTP